MNFYLVFFYLIFADFIFISIDQYYAIWLAWLMLLIPTVR